MQAIVSGKATYCVSHRDLHLVNGYFTACTCWQFCQYLSTTTLSKAKSPNNNVTVSDWLTQCVHNQIQLSCVDDHFQVSSIQQTINCNHKKHVSKFTVTNVKCTKTPLKFHYGTFDYITQFWHTTYNSTTTVNHQLKHTLHKSMLLLDVYWMMMMKKMILMRMMIIMSLIRHKFAPATDVL